MPEIGSNEMNVRFCAEKCNARSVDSVFIEIEPDEYPAFSELLHKLSCMARTPQCRVDDGIAFADIKLFKCFV